MAAAGAAFVRAQQAAGVAATAKHFPGLGTAPTEANTDRTPVTLDTSPAELDATDEPPFRAAIAAGVELVMPSWAVYPHLDPDVPAGLSRKVLHGRLRERLGFTGVTITDALEAGSLAAHGGDAQRAVLAAEAGADLLLCSGGDVAQGEQVRAALQGADHDAALARILALRNRLEPSDASGATRRYGALRGPNGVRE